MNKVLVIVAHPDDEVLGMGGTIAKLTSEGKEVHLLIVTDGSTSQYSNNSNLSQIIVNKKIETEKSANILGISSITYGNLPDMMLDITPHIEINKVIENAIELIKPDTVFTHFYGDVNLDHQRVFKSVMVACRPLNTQCAKNLLCFNVPSSTEWNNSTINSTYIPNYFVDISLFENIKLNALGCYKTELRDFPHPRSIEYIKKDDEMTGLKVGLKYSESFIILRKIED